MGWSKLKKFFVFIKLTIIQFVTGIMNFGINKPDVQEF